MKTITVTAKCSDMFSAYLTNNGGLKGQVYSGYVPKWFPNYDTNHYGDYIELKIDIETGRILNWKCPSNKDLQETFKLS